MPYKNSNQNNSNNKLFNLARPAKLDIDIPENDNKKIENNNADQLERTPKIYRKDMGQRGFYDKRNNLNDLTGKEWKFMSKSVITRSYPPDLQHALRSDSVSNRSSGEYFLSWVLDDAQLEPIVLEMLKLRNIYLTSPHALATSLFRTI